MGREVGGGFRIRGHMYAHVDVWQKPPQCCEVISHQLKLINFFKFIYLHIWLHWVFVAIHGLSLVALSRGYSLIMGYGILLAVASLVAPHRF